MLIVYVLPSVGGPAGSPQTDSLTDMSAARSTVYSQTQETSKHTSYATPVTIVSTGYVLLYRIRTKDGEVRYWLFSYM